MVPCGGRPESEAASVPPRRPRRFSRPSSPPSKKIFSRPHPREAVPHETHDPSPRSGQQARISPLPSSLRTSPASTSTRGWTGEAHRPHGSRAASGRRRSPPRSVSPPRGAGGGLSSSRSTPRGGSRRRSASPPRTPGAGRPWPVRAQGLPRGGKLLALQIDPKATFERLLARVASPEALERIHENRLYAGLVDSLPGVLEYMGVEALHEHAADPDVDLVVLDTPPAARGLDFLDAPGRMVELLENDALRFFLRSDSLLGGRSRAPRRAARPSCGRPTRSSGSASSRTSRTSSAPSTASTTASARGAARRLRAPRRGPLPRRVLVGRVGSPNGRRTSRAKLARRGAGARAPSQPRPGAARAGSASGGPRRAARPRAPGERGSRRRSCRPPRRRARPDAQPSDASRVEVVPSGRRAPLRRRAPRHGPSPRTARVARRRPCSVLEGRRRHERAAKVERLPRGEELDREDGLEELHVPRRACARRSAPSRRGPPSRPRSGSSPPTPGTSSPSPRRRAPRPSRGPS